MSFISEIQANYEITAMKYDIVIKYENGKEDTIKSGLNQQLAKKTAKEAANQYKGKVYIEWFRKKDGQHGYLNPNGDHNPVGKPW